VPARVGVGLCLLAMAISHAAGQNAALAIPNADFEAAEGDVPARTTR